MNTVHPQVNSLYQRKTKKCDMIIAIVFQHLKNLKDILDLLSPVLRSVIYILTYLVGIPFLLENDGNRNCFFFPTVLPGESN